jgi:dCMP deaminase
MTRKSWDSIWMTMADTVAGRSLCSRAQVGCVLVTSDNQIAAATYNGPSPRFDHQDRPCTAWCERSNKKTVDIVDPRSYADCPASHAEASALIRADASRLSGATIYVTGSVCINCAKLITHSGVVRVVHRVDPANAYRAPLETEKYLTGLGVVVERWALDQIQT